MFKTTLDHHAPVKTVQIKTQKSPFISDATRVLLMRKKYLRKQAKQKKTKELRQEIKELEKKIKTSLIKDENEYPPLQQCF